MPYNMVCGSAFAREIYAYIACASDNDSPLASWSDIVIRSRYQILAFIMSIRKLVYIYCTPRLSKLELQQLM